MNKTTEQIIQVFVNRFVVTIPTFMHCRQFLRYKSKRKALFQNNIRRILVVVQ